MDLFFLPPAEILIVLGLVALVAGYFDAMAGGSGLLTLPALLLAGLPAQLALGTNKLQSNFGSMTSSVVYWRHGLVYPKTRRWMFPLAFVSSFAGCYTVLHIPPVDMSRIIAGALVLIAAYFLFHKDREEKETEPRWSLAGLLLGPVLVGFYDGFLGPGTGSFLIFIMLHFFKMDYIHSAANGKFVNWGSNLGALAGYFLFGKVLIFLGLIMGVCMFAGARMGSWTAIRHGSRIIKPLVVTVSLLMVLKLLLQN
ncbi:MAG: TSUP family transporter [Bacteroidetes bacterium]|nr:TSUP family transporter [Bacteroidota bacterium]